MLMQFQILLQPLARAALFGDGARSVQANGSAAGLLRAFATKSEDKNAAGQKRQRHETVSGAMRNRKH